jgi:hypothetical protein
MTFDYPIPQSVRDGLDQIRKHILSAAECSDDDDVLASLMRALASFNGVEMDIGGALGLAVREGAMRERGEES